MFRLSTSYSKLFLYLFATVLFIGFLSSSLLVKPALAVTGINRQINFQGKLVNPDGTNVADSTYSVVFTLYDATSGGTNLWTETDSVTTSNGIFRVSLGANTSISANFNFNWSGLYLGIKVGSDAEMTPRVQMTAVPFAFNAQQVAGLTVQDTSGNASTSGTLQIPNAKTVSFGNAFTTSATGALTINAFDSGGNTLSLPATGAITLVGTTQIQDLTNKTYNGLTVTSSTLKPTVAGGLAIDANGSNTLSLGANDGNAITFGKSGTTYTLNGLTGNQSDILSLGSSGSLTTIGTTALSQQCLLSSGSSSGPPVWGSCGAAGPSSPFQSVGGTLQEINTTQDLLLGGIASSSATFHVFGSTLAGTNPVASISANTSFAGLVVDNKGKGDLFTASSSGLSRFTITQSGGIGLGANASIGTSSQCLLGGSAASWGTCGTGGGASPFQSVGGTIQAINNTQDFLLGGLATSSAKFAVLGLNTGSTPIASLSAQTGNTGLSLNSNGAIQTYDANSLTLGGAGTGNIIFSPNGATGEMMLSSTGLTLGAGSTNGLLTFFTTGGGKTSPSISTDVSGNLNLTAPSGTVNVGNGTGNITFDSGSNNVLFGFNSVNFAGFYHTNQFAIGTASPSGTVDLRGLSGTTSVASISGKTSFAGLVVDNTGKGDIFTASSSGLSRFTITQSGGIGLGSSNNVGTSSQCLLGGSSASWGTCGTGGGTSPFQSVGGTIQEINNTQDLLLGGTSTTSADFAFININSGTPTASIAGTTHSNALSLDGNGNIQTQNSNTLILGGATTGSIVLSAHGTQSLTILPNGFVGIGTSAIAATLDVRNILGTSPTASISGATSNAGLVVDNSGKGDLFTASSSGLSRFTITQSGGIGLGSSNNVGTSSQCLLGGSTASWGVCATGGSSSPFQSVGGTIQELNNTQDLLLGGIASSSATFHVFGAVNAGTNPVASISAHTTFAGLVVDNSGTGDIFTASSSGLTRFTIGQNGNITAGGTAGFSNAIANFGGSVNNYLQVNNQNRSNGGSASSDYVATADNGTDTSNYIDFGVNSSGYNDASYTIGGPDDGYLYTNGGDLTLGTQTQGTNIKFHAGGTLASNEVMRLDGSGTIATASISAHTSFAGLVVDNSGTGDIFTASSSGKSRFTIKSNGGLTLPTDSSSVAEGVMFGTTTPMSIYRSAAGKLTVGDGTNGLTVDTNSSGTAITYTGNSRPNKTITLSPEYAGAVLTQFYGAGTDATPASGSNMTSDADTTTGTSIRTFYEWKATNASQQFYTVAVRVTLPKDFSAWATSNAVVVNYITQSATSTNSSLDVRVYNDNSSSVVASTTGLTSTSWTTTAFGSSSLAGWATAGQSAVIYLRMGSASSNYVHIGDIQLNYLASF